MRSGRLNSVIDTFQFILAGTLTTIVSALAIAFVLAKAKTSKNKAPKKINPPFLQNKNNALNFYRIFSATYDILNPHFYTQKMRTEITEQIEGEDLRILDVGCGTGYTSKGILSQKGVVEVIGMDMNPVQLGRAAKNLHNEKARVSLFRGDAENLPFRDDSFAAVVSVGAIEYFPNPELAVEEMTRVAKKGGKVIVGGPELAWFRKITLDRFFYTPSKPELKEMFVKAGLNEEERLIGVNTVFETQSYVVVATGCKKTHEP